YWAKKDDGVWSVPKGLVNPNEDELACARREFKEETGFETAEGGRERDLGIFPQPSGKRLHVWAIDGDCNPADLKSNLFEMKWPSWLRIRRLETASDREIEGLSDVLRDCVEGGASVGFLLPLTRGKAEAFWRGASASAARGERVVLVAEEQAGAIVGTAQVI